MVNISGTNVAAGIAPFTTDDKFPTHYSKYGAGGWHEVETEAEKDLIPDERKVAGMAVYVVESSKLYLLQKDGSWLENKVDLSAYLTKAEALEKYLEKSQYVDDKELMFGDIDFSTYKEKSYVLQILVKLEQSFIDDLGNPDNINGQPYNAQSNNYKLGDSYLCFAGFDESLVFHYDLWDNSHSGLLFPAVAEAINISEKESDKKYTTKEELLENLNKKADKDSLSTVATSGSYNDVQNKPQINSVELSGNKTLEELGIQVSGNYVTEDELKAKDYATNSSVDSKLALKADKTAIPTKVSQLTNDSGYLTAVPSEYITETELTEKGYDTVSSVDAKLSNKADKATTLQGYGITDAYTKTEVDAKVSSVYRFKGSVDNFDALPSEGNVVGDVYNVEDTGANYAWTGEAWDKLSETVDLTNYALKSEIPTNVSQLNNDSKYVNSDTLNAELVKKQNVLTFDEVPTESSSNPVKSSGIYTELSKKADKGELPQVAISGSYTDLTSKPQINSVELTGNKSLADLGIQPKGNYLTEVPVEYVTETELTEKGYDTVSSVDAKLSTKANKSEIPTKVSQLTNDSGYLSSIPEEYVTETELNAKDFATNTSVDSKLSTKADKSEIPELPENITTQGNEFNGANQLVKLDASGKLPAIDGSQLTGITSGTFNYTELNNKPQINNVELSGNKTLEELGIQAKGNYLTSIDIENKADKSEIPTKVSQLENDSNFISSIPAEYITETELTEKGYDTVSSVDSKLTNKADKSTTLQGYGITDAYTKTEVDEKIPEPYTLPIATDSILGGIKVGTGLSITEDGILSNTKLGEVTSVNGDVGEVTVKSIQDDNTKSTMYKVWVGTKEQYDLIEEKDPAVLYYIKNEGEPIDVETELSKKQDKLTAGVGIDLSGNVVTNTKPNVQADWNSVEGLSQILNKPTLSNVATSGSYNDLTDTPEPYTLPTASSDTLGGVKIGSGLAISDDGILSSTTSGGTTDYTELNNKPQINSVELSGNKSLDDLGIQPKGNYLTEVPAEYITETELNSKGYDTVSNVDSKLSTKADKSTTLQGYGITDAYTKEEVDAKVSSVYKFKGSVANFEALPSESNVIGDVYNVEDTGANYAWDGTEWDKLSETVDLTNYALKSELPTKVSQLENDSNYLTEAPVTSVNGETGEVSVKSIQDDNTKSTMYKVWVGTKEQYDLIVEKDPQTLYYIQDDGSLVDIYELIDKKQDKLTPGTGIEITEDGSINNTKPNVQADWSAVDGDSQILNKPTLSNVATSGSYNDLTDKPAIPELPENITTQGNEFNGVNQLVKLDESGKLPAIDGSQLTGIVIEVPIATNEVAGIVKPDGSSITITPEGVISSTVKATTDYTELNNKPQINSVELSGNKSLDDLGIQPKGNYLTEIPDEYITETELTEKGYDTVSNVDSKLSSKANKATTLQGYGITDAYTKTEVDEKIPEPYTLPIASSATLGGVKVGTGLSITEDGILSNTKLGEVTSVNGETGEVTVKSIQDDNTKSTMYKVWVGTKEEYDLIAEKDPTVLYYIKNEGEPIDVETELSKKQDKLTAGVGIDLSGNTVTNTSPNVQADWNSVEGLSQILNKPTLSTVATSGSYNDLTDKPTIPELPENITTQGNEFNIANKLVQLDSEGKLPAIDGSQLTGITSGTTDYTNLTSKPQINNIELSGNKSLDDLGIQAKGNYLTEAPVTSVNGETGEVTVKAIQNSSDQTMLKIWTGTKEEYDLIEEKDPNTLYYVKKDGEPINIQDELDKKQDKLTAGTGIEISGTTINCTTTYSSLVDKPQINNIELSGNKTLEELGIQPKGDYLTATDIENKADKSTTLQGYGITDAYTKTEVDEKIPEPYVLPTASSDTLGGVKVGTGLLVSGDGTLTVDYTNTIEELVNGNVVADKIYKATITSATTFVLPQVSDNRTHSIIIYATISEGGSIADFGTVRYYNTDTLSVGDTFDLIYVYNPVLNTWVYNIVKVN